MASQTGRTLDKYIKFQLEDSGGTFRDIPITQIGDVGLDYPDVDLSAIQDAVKGFKSGQPDFTLTIQGPFDNTVVQAASGSASPAALSGSHTVLKDLYGELTPLGFAVYIGIQQDWETGEPVFGLASTAANGVLCVGYKVQPADASYSASFKLYPGSAPPTWGTAVIS